MKEVIIKEKHCNHVYLEDINTDKIYLADVEKQGYYLARKNTHTGKFEFISLTNCFTYWSSEHDTLIDMFKFEMGNSYSVRIYEFSNVLDMVNFISHKELGGDI